MAQKIEGLARKKKKWRESREEKGGRIQERKILNPNVAGSEV